MAGSEGCATDPETNKFENFFREKNQFDNPARNRLNTNVEQVQSEIDEMIEQFRENAGLLNPVSRMMKE